MLDQQDLIARQLERGQAIADHEGDQDIAGRIVRHERQGRTQDIPALSANQFAQWR